MLARRRRAVARARKRSKSSRAYISLSSKLKTRNSMSPHSFHSGALTRRDSLRRMQGFESVVLVLQAANGWKGSASARPARILILWRAVTNLTTHIRPKDPTNVIIIAFSIDVARRKRSETKRSDLGHHSSKEFTLMGSQDRRAHQKLR